MPWKDDSKAKPPHGPWDAPSSPTPPPKAARGPWDPAPQDDPTPPRPRIHRPRRSPSPDEAGAPRAAEPRPKGKAIGKPARPALRRSKAAATPAPSVRRAPDLAALKRRLDRAASDRLSGPLGRRTQRALVAGAALGVLCGWAAGGLYRVGPDQAGVVERFGAFVGQTGPGLHYHLPWPVGRVRVVTVGPSPPDAVGRRDDLDGSERMLTAEGDPVQVTYAVNWRVSDPRRYLFHIADAPALLAQLGQGAVRRAVGATPLTTLVEGDRAPAEDAAGHDLQQALDRMGAGVQVSSVDLRGIDAAPLAQGAARDLAAAREDARAETADADAYRDRVTAAARGEAAKALAEAQGAADQEVAEAKGEADRFSALDAAYRQAPAATRERLYTETMERVLKATNKVVVDAPKGSTLVLPASIAPQRPADAATTPPPSPAPSAPQTSGAPGAGGAA